MTLTINGEARREVKDVQVSKPHFKQQIFLQGKEISSVDFYENSNDCTLAVTMANGKRHVRMGDCRELKGVLDDAVTCMGWKRVHSFI